MNRSNMTSFSFTVEDDLISETSANTTFIKPKPFGAKPFTKDFGMKGADGLNKYQQVHIPTIQKRIAEQAQNDAYRELNNDLFNPFEHKLNHNFIHKEGDLYERQKQKQIQLIKKRQMDMLNSAKNYTIVFNNNSNPPGRSLQVAANNILAEDTPQSIGDYYKQKFKKNQTPLQEISQQNEEKVKKNNFVAQKSVKKRQKSREQDKRVSTGEKVKIIKSSEGWKKQFNSDKEIDINAKRQQINKPVYTPPNLPKPQKQKVVNKPPSKPENKNEGISKKPQPIKNQKSTSQSKSQKKPTTNGKKPFSQVYEGADRNLVQQLQKQISECPNITFEDIAQLQTAKGLLQQAVLLPRMMPQFFKGIRKAMKGILLFGPPGTGKTLLAKAIASNNMFFNVSASSLASKWKGDSQKMVRLLFQMARYHSPSVIFFDQIDSIATKRSQNQHQSTRKVKTELLVQMDGVGNSEQSVFVLAATNRPWDLDQALRRRLQKRIYIPLPGKQGRKKMFEINLKQLKLSEKIDWDKLVQLTKGCSGADICNICRDAAYMPMRKKLTQLGGIHKISQLSQHDLLNQEITEADLIEAAKKIKPSVGNQDLKRYMDWMKEFGSS